MNASADNEGAQGPQDVLTTKEAADLLGVSLKSVQIWSEGGLLDSWKTAGGHRRISRESVLRVIKSRQSGNSERGADPAWNGSRSGGESPLSVYVVEDDPLYQKIYRFKLSNWYPQPRLLTFSSGYEALVRIGQELPDLLIADVRMPGMNGIDMVKALQRMPECAGIEVVVVSALSPEELEELGGVPEGVRALSKPIQFSELESIAASIAERKRSV